MQYAHSPRAGLDLGGTKIQAVVADATGHIFGEARRPTPTDGGLAGVVAALAETLREAGAIAGVALSDLAGLGIGTPGAVDRARGTVVGAGNVPGFDGEVALAELVSRALGGLPTRLGNDVGVALDAEAHVGAGRGRRSFVGVWWGTGIGGGVVIDGRRWLGRGAAGEIGHVVVKRGGAACPCGRKGCLEAYAGRRAMELAARRAHERGRRTRLFEWMEKKGRDRLTSGVWVKALAAGDELAIELVDRAVRAIGVAAASAVNLLDVEAIVMGGGLGTRLGPEYAARIAESMQPHLFVPSRPPAVVTSALGDLGGALGASLLAA